ncbi:MAG: molybdopterin adenylyltransferase [Phycisphaerales bacterium]|nr:molybdopterin adenylyltransferase [Phycisphaerales bacterium]
MPVPIGILVVSDRAADGVYEDRGGPAVQDWLADRLNVDWTACVRLVHDEKAEIKSALIELCDGEHCPLVLTTGGTGPAARDVTPEVTEEVCDRLLPGFGEQMRRASFEVVPTAILSRQTAGHRGGTLIINLPGKPSAVADCLEAVFDAIPYCIDLLGGPRLETSPPAWRPRPKGSGR